MAKYVGVCIDDDRARIRDQGMMITPRADGWEVVLALPDIDSHVKIYPYLEREVRRVETSRFLDRDLKTNVNDPRWRPRPEDPPDRPPRKLSLRYLASFDVGETRPSVIAKISINRDGQVTATSFEKGDFQTLQAMTFDQFESMVANGDAMANSWNACAQAIWKGLGRDGYKSKHQISLVVTAVSQLVNREAAKFLLEKEAPAMFTFSEFDVRQAYVDALDAGDPEAMMNIYPDFEMLTADPARIPNGLPAYTRITAPLQFPEDWIALRQLSSLLAEKDGAPVYPHYSQQEMDMLVGRIEARSKPEVTFMNERDMDRWQNTIETMIRDMNDADLQEHLYNNVDDPDLLRMVVTSVLRDIRCDALIRECEYRLVQFEGKGFKWEIARALMSDDGIRPNSQGAAMAEAFVRFLDECPGEIFSLYKDLPKVCPYIQSSMIPRPTLRSDGQWRTQPSIIIKPERGGEVITPGVYFGPTERDCERAAMLDMIAGLIQPTEQPPVLILGAKLSSS